MLLPLYYLYITNILILTWYNSPWARSQRMQAK